MLVSLGSSWRCCGVEDTLTRARRLMVPLGISRVMDITRMDRLGLPVFASVRPRGMALRVHAGKGLRSEEAEAGALMEAIEFAVAEPQATDWAATVSNPIELGQQLGRGLRMADLAPRFGVRPEPATLLPAVTCERLGDAQPVLLPAELVFVPFEPPGRAALFGWSSNGLASGNSVAEATLHGLSEVLERDAVAMNRPSDSSTWILPESLPPPFVELADRWRRECGVRLSVRSLPNAWSLPCFQALLYDPGSEDVNLAGGTGLHLNAGVALARAVCEAAQSRLSAIHGGRDDVTDYYAKFNVLDHSTRRTQEAALVNQAFETSDGLPFDALPTSESPLTSAEAVLAGLLDRLETSGFQSVFRHRYAIDLGGLQVVRVIVPGCEDFDPVSRRIGPRLAACIASRG